MPYVWMYIDDLKYKTLYVQKYIYFVKSKKRAPLFNLKNKIKLFLISSNNLN